MIILLCGVLCVCSENICLAGYKYRWHSCTTGDVRPGVGELPEFRTGGKYYILAVVSVAHDGIYNNMIYIFPGAICRNGPLFCAFCFAFDNYKLQTNIFWCLFWFILLFCFAFCLECGKNPVSLQRENKTNNNYQNLLTYEQKRII